jgi:hypothetical protein
VATREIVQDSTIDPPPCDGNIGIEKDCLVEAVSGEKTSSLSESGGDAEGMKNFNPSAQVNVVMKNGRRLPADIVAAPNSTSSSLVASELFGHGMVPHVVEPLTPQKALHDESGFTGETFTRDDLVEEVTAIQIRRLKAQVDAENAAAIMAPKSPKASGSSETKSWFSALFSSSSPGNKNSIPPPSSGGDESAIVDIYDNSVDLDEGDRVRDFSMLDDDEYVPNLDDELYAPDEDAQTEAVNVRVKIADDERSPHPTPSALVALKLVNAANQLAGAQQYVRSSHSR